MKRLLIILLFTIPAAAQDKTQNSCPPPDDKKAVQYYKNGIDRKKYKDKRDRISFLKKALEIEPEYADIYWALAKEAIRSAVYDGAPLDPARKNLNKVLELCPDYDPYLYYYLGSIYMGADEYGKAADNLSKFILFDLPPDYRFSKDHEEKFAEAQEWLKTAKFYSNLYDNPVPFDPKPVEGLCTTEDEYLAMISPDNELAFFTKKYQRRGMNDLIPKLVEEFTLGTRHDSIFINIEPLPPPFNIGDNYGGSTISVDNKYLYITSCKPNTIGYNNCDIFYSKYEYFYDESYDRYRYAWSDLENLGENVNTNDGWEAQPSISSDGKTIFFAGARADSKGMDIYMSKKDSLGNWGKATRLGDKINTDKNEKSPFIHSDSHTLYFSSDGHPGIGGYDIFYSRKDENGEWMEPVNIGYPINTTNDEVGFFASTNGKTGYFASNKLKTGKGGYDIFSFPLYKEARPQKVLLVKGEVKDENGQIPDDARVELKNLQTKKVTEIEVDHQTGKYAAVVNVEDGDDDFIMSIKKEEYSFTTNYISIRDTSFDAITKVDMEIKPIEIGDAYRLHHINFETNSANVLTQKSMAILDEFVDFLHSNTTLIVAIHGHTDNIGNDQANLELSHSRSKAVNDYLILSGVSGNRLTWKGFGASKPVESNGTEEGRAKNRRTEFVVMSKG